MVSPNTPSSSQTIIDNFLLGNYQTTDSTNPYLVPVTPYTPPADPTIPDCGALYPNENRIYDPLSSSCVIVPEEEIFEGNDREVEEEPYQGVGSINSPTQNAFGNLGLGSMYGGQEISKSGFGFDNFNQGLQSILGMTPLGLPLRMGRSQDINTLINSGVIEKGSDGKLTFAKGGNLNLVQANQAFEQNLARQQGLNLDAVSANPYIDQSGKEQFMVQSRGDKADNMSNNVYKDNNATVSINPFKSDYGAKEIVSYKPKNTYTSKYNQSKQGNPFER